MKTATLLLTLACLSLASCWSEWDYPRVPRTDKCTGQVQDRVVYVQPCSPNPPPPKHPRDAYETEAR